MKAGADVLAKDSNGHTPLDLARIWCHRKIARYRAKGTSRNIITVLQKKKDLLYVQVPEKLHMGGRKEARNEGKKAG